ncbi:hypothetical protein B0H19DRAFT_1194032 [Mycena capillaripes]|nr:hypothetical protein B0H19DRAFT_1194032 [Mycena capillaripes]
MGVGRRERRASGGRGRGQWRVRILSGFFLVVPYTLSPCFSFVLSFSTFLIPFGIMPLLFYLVRYSSKLYMDASNSYSLYLSLISVLCIRLLTRFIHNPPNPSTPTQRHLIAQPANILHPFGADAECACAGTSITVSTSSAPAQVPPAREKVSGSGSEKDQDDGGRWR